MEKEIIFIVSGLTKEQIDDKVRELAEKNFGCMSAYSYYRRGDKVIITRENN